MIRQNWLHGAALFAFAAAGAQAQSIDLQNLKTISGSPGHATYHASTGKLVIDWMPGSGGHYLSVGPNTVWDASDASAGFVAATRTPAAATYDELLDWGDINNNTRINGFDFAYATDLVTPLPVAPGTGLTMNVAFYASENGINTAGSTLIQVFNITDLPGVDPAQSPPPFPGQFDGWVITVDLSGGGEFTINGSDLDGDGRADFGYSYWVANNGSGSDAGPLVANVGPAPSGMPGAEDAFDMYSPGPGKHAGSPYAGSFWYGGVPFAQHYLTLYEDDCATSTSGVANPNTTGQPSVIGSQNFPSMSANNFVLTCTQLPPNKPGLFILSKNKLANPVPLFSGWLYLGSGIRRLAGVSTGPAGTVSFPVDFTVQQFNGIGVNDKIYVQFWHRDVGGTANLSNVLEVTLCQ